MMEHQPRTPSAWIILLARFNPHKNTPFGVDDGLGSRPVPNPVLRVGHFRRTLLVYSCKAPKRSANEPTFARGQAALHPDPFTASGTPPRPGAAASRQYYKDGCD